MTTQHALTAGLLILLAGTSGLAAAPTPAGVAGTLTHGQSVTVQGRGFGARGDFHQDADKMIRAFDDFNRGALDGNGYLTWLTFNAEEQAATWRSYNPRTNLPGDGYYHRSNVGLGWIGLKGENHSEYYISFYMRLSDGFDIASAGSGSHQFKIVRLYATNNNITLYPAIGADDGFHIELENTSPTVMRYQLQLDAIPNRPAGWHKMAVYIKKNTSSGARDGKLKIWWDNKQVFDWRSHFANPKNNPDYAPGYPITGDFEANDANFAGDWAIGNYFSSASPLTAAHFDDIYVDHSLARVELGNADTYDACTLLETQPPARWSDGAVTFTVNAGGFPDLAKAYLYVTDAEGTVNLSGLPVTVSAPQRPDEGAGADPYRPAQKFVSPAASTSAARAIAFHPDIVQVIVYDQSAGKVREMEKEDGAPLEWDGRDGRGNAVASGVYICKIKAASGRVLYHTVVVVK